MNSCTLTSKQIRKRLLYGFFLIVALMAILDGIIYYVIDSRTTKYSFVEEKQSKIKHFNLNYKKHRDIVFIGDSRTIFHISSKVFKKNGLDIYNFGVSGNSLVNYPSYVINAISQEPKMIVLNLGINELYKPLEKILNPSFLDIMFYNKIGREKLFLESVYQWFLSYHTIFNYSEVLVFKAKLLYENFNPPRNKKYITSSKSLDSKSIIQYDCTPFVTQKVNEHKTIVRCTNGDGFLLGNIETNSSVERLKNISISNIFLLKNIVNLIEDAHIEVLILFEPILYNQYIIENNLFDNLKGINFLNLSDYTLDKKFIADAGHFNVYGRKIYSEFLAKKLKSKLND